MSEFQSPQWGSNSKTVIINLPEEQVCFSPRNGEVILNRKSSVVDLSVLVSVPAMGK